MPPSIRILYLKIFPWRLPPPGFPKVNVPFTPNQINEYSSSDLNLFCGDDTNLPDGIYTFKYSIFPNLENQVSKSFLYTNNIVGDYQRKYAQFQLDCTCDKDISKEKEKLQNIKIFIEGAIAAANQCQNELAYTLLRKAQELISRVDCQC